MMDQGGELHKNPKAQQAFKSVVTQSNQQALVLPIKTDQWKETIKLLQTTFAASLMALILTLNSGHVHSIS